MVSNHCVCETSRKIVCALLILATFAHGSRAEDVLSYLPEDALGFAVVRDLDKTSAKAERFLQMFNLNVPTPLAFAQFSTGLGEGIDKNGDLLIALIPGSRPTSLPEPMVLLPISDYEKFSASIQGDTSGEVCRVAIAGEDVLVARNGAYAILMNVEHRETLEILLGMEPEVVAPFKPLDAWLQSNQASFVIMPTGVEKLVTLGRQELAKQRQVLADRFGDPQLGHMLQSARQGFVFYDILLNLVGKEIYTVAFGVEIDASNNLRLGYRFLLENQSVGESSHAESSVVVEHLKGYPDQPFVFAGGGSFQGEWVSRITEMSVNLMQQMPELYGLQDASKDQWNELRESYREATEKMLSGSMIMLPGEKGEPLSSNMFGVFQVDDANAYLESYRKSVNLWRKLMEGSTSDIKMDYQLKELTVGDHKAYELEVDVASAAQDPNVPMFNWMLESMFGEDGKVRSLIVAVDETNLVFGMSNEQRVLKVIEQLKQREQGLRQSAGIQTTSGLLPQEAAWRFYVSPPGCVQWIQRILDELLAQMIGQSIEIPDFAACPPVGISLDFKDSQADVDVVAPVDSLEALADFIEKCKEL